MTDTPHPLTTAEQETDRAHRAAALEHAARYAPQLPEFLGSMPTPAGTPAEVHAALDLLRAALEETGAAAIRDPLGHPAWMYGAACASHARTLGVFLHDLEPTDPHRAAVLFITYTAAMRDQLAAGTPEAAAFLEGADGGDLTPEAAGAALNALPDGDTLACFLGAHHAFSLAVEALADPTDTDPRGKLRDALEVMRKEIRTVTPSRADA